MPQSTASEISQSIAGQHALTLQTRNDNCMLLIRQIREMPHPKINLSTDYLTECFWDADERRFTLINKGKICVFLRLHLHLRQVQVSASRL